MKLELIQQDSFSSLKTKMHEHFGQMIADVDHLFVVELDKDTFWKLYLDSFPGGTNPLVRERTEHDCSACRYFIKSFGNVVKIKDNKITTIWDFEMPGSKYDPVIKNLANFVRSHPVSDVFITNVSKFGVDKNYEKSESGDIIAWEHFYVELPKKFLCASGEMINSEKGRYRDIRIVFERSLMEISVDSIETVLELIAQNSLYRGAEWKTVLESFLKYKKDYEMVPQDERNNFLWEKSIQAGSVIGKIRNHSMGVLLIDITNGVDLDNAVRKYEAIVAPSNYKRPKPIFTEKMVLDAEKKITELGYLQSLPRRHAILEDITVNNILYVDRDTAPRVLGGNVFLELTKDAVVRPKKFDRIEEVSIQKFIADILPTAQKIELLLEPRHMSNMVSLIAPVNRDAPSMFKWSNGFSWAYAGNIADSMKQRVKALGGNVSGVLRFSIQWNEKHDNEDDLDAHAKEPYGTHIFYGNKGYVHRSSGVLDVDIIYPSKQAPGGIAVENIVWTDQNRMPEGTYQFFVNCYSSRGARSGFSAEVEFDGQIYRFNYPNPLRAGENVPVADVVYDRRDGFKLIEKLPYTGSSVKVWGLGVNQFHPVSVIMYSPNYWDEQTGNGNRHFFFMLKDCRNTENPNGFYNEFLKNELLEHKHVFEALGNKMRVRDSEEQLSGIGFSSTQRNSVVVRVKGNVDRTIKVVI